MFGESFSNACFERDAMYVIDGHPRDEDWWLGKRWLYNISLVVAGISAFVCNHIVIDLFSETINNVEVGEMTILAIGGQSICFLIMMWMANMFYGLGLWAEKKFKPNDVRRFRRITFRLGYWFSVGLPFMIPLTNLYFCLFMPEVYQSGY